MPVDIATSPLFVVSNTSGNRIQERATDIVPEQYTLTDSLDNDKPENELVTSPPFFECSLSPLQRGAVAVEATNNLK